MTAAAQHGSEKNSQGVEWLGTWSTGAVFSWTCWGWHVPLASHNNGTKWQSLPGWSVFLDNSLSHRLSLQTTKGCIYNKNLSPQYQQQWQHLSGYSALAVVSGTHYFKSSLVHLLTVMWSESRWSFSARDCAHLQNRQREVQQNSSGMDTKVCNVVLENCGYTSTTMARGLWKKTNRFGFHLTALYEPTPPFAPCTCLPDPAGLCCTYLPCTHAYLTQQCCAVLYIFALWTCLPDPAGLCCVVHIWNSKLANTVLPVSCYFGIEHRSVWRASWSVVTKSCESKSIPYHFKLGYFEMCFFFFSCASRQYFSLLISGREMYFCINYQEFC